MAKVTSRKRKMLFDDFAQRVVDRLEATGESFFKVDAITRVERDPIVMDAFDRARRYFPKTLDVVGELRIAVESAVTKQLHRKDRFKFRIFETFPDPMGRGLGRLYMPLDQMKAKQLAEAIALCKSHRKEMVKKEDRYAVLMRHLEAAGPSATVATVKAAAWHEISRMEARHKAA